MTDAEAWAALYTVAGLKRSIDGALANPVGVRGRFISILARKLAEFWGAHEATLRPYLTQLAIAALDALITALPDILAVNTPGPE